MQVRSPSALVASLLCLVAAAALASLGSPAPADLGGAHLGDAMVVKGSLVDYEPDPAWTDVQAVLEGTTYAVVMEGVSDLVLLTGMEDGWEDHTVIAEAVVIYERQHPEGAGDIIVLAVDDPDDVDHLLG